MLLVVAAGGAVGACLRWALGQAFPVVGGHFPWTTFAINVSGAAALATLPGITFVRRHRLLPPALGTGLLGGFTTLSAYAEESRALVADGRSALAATYVVGTFAACLVTVALVDAVVSAAWRAEFDAEEGDL